MMERNHHVTNLGLPPSDDILDQYNVLFALLDRMPVVLLPLFVSGFVYQKASGPEKEKKQQFATVSFPFMRTEAISHFIKRSKNFYGNLYSSLFSS